MSSRVTYKRVAELVREANHTTFADTPHGVVLDGHALYLQSRKEASKKVLLHSSNSLRELIVALQVVTNITLRRSA